MTVGVFLVDDHPMFREGMRIALESSGELKVVGEAFSGEDALDLVPELGSSVDVVLMDLRLPGISGLETIRELTADAASGPAGTHRPRVLVVSMSAEDDEVVAVLRAGAHGYVTKDASRDVLLRAVLTVVEGGAVFSSDIAQRLGTYFSAVHELPSRAAFPHLTDREREVLDLVARGYSNRRIARALVLSEKTVRNHVSHIFAKLQVNDRSMAGVRARDAGLGR
ncbi:response regulator [Streptomyces uncialis]|uniref:response regulator n=1 Tax=Streptomyces uncialis TaxID=1048205 RepID=UPI0036478DF0